MDLNEQLPAGAQLVRTTPEWTVDTVPRALLSSHKTSVWAQLVVVEGEVRFIDEDSGNELIASPGLPVVIAPQRLHHVEPLAAARFCVQFFTEADDAP